MDPLLGLSREFTTAIGAKILAQRKGAYMDTEWGPQSKC